MKVGFLNYTLQKTNFKGLFEVEDVHGKPTYINTDQVTNIVKCSAEKGKKFKANIYQPNSCTSTKELSVDDFKLILKNYSSAATAKDKIVTKNGDVLVKDGSLVYKPTSYPSV